MHALAVRVLVRAHGDAGGPARLREAARRAPATCAGCRGRARSRGAPRATVSGRSSGTVVTAMRSKPRSRARASARARSASPTLGVDGGVDEILRAVERRVADDRRAVERDPAVGAVRAAERVRDVLALDLGDPEGGAAARRQQVEDRRRDRRAVRCGCPPRGNGTLPPTPPSSSGLGRRPFTPVARVRIPLGVLDRPGASQLAIIEVFSRMTDRAPRFYRAANGHSADRAVPGRPGCPCRTPEARRRGEAAPSAARA